MGKRITTSQRVTSLNISRACINKKSSTWKERAEDIRNNSQKMVRLALKSEEMFSVTNNRKTQKSAPHRHTIVSHLSGDRDENIWYFLGEEGTLMHC